MLFWAELFCILFRVLPERRFTSGAAEVVLLTLIHNDISALPYLELIIHDRAHRFHANFFRGWLVINYRRRCAGYVFFRHGMVHILMLNSFFTSAAQST